MSIEFDSTYYLNTYPDVLQAILLGQFSSAEEHYNLHGWAENRNPHPDFDTAYYKANNPDVVAAVLAGAFDSPLEHFLLHGAAEGRAPNAEDAQLIALFDETAYLTANPDVAAAVAAGAFDNGLEHFLIHGQYENRPGTPVLPPVGETFDLTQGTDAGPAFQGGDGDDTYNAQAVQTALLPIQTLNNSDDLDGGLGRDTLNAQLTNLFTVPAGLTNIEVLNLEGNPGFLGLLPLTSTLDVVNANAIDEINFRTPSNGIIVNNLGTALSTLGLYDDGGLFGGNAFVVNHVGTATDGSSDSLDLNLRNNNAAGGSSLLLTHTGGGADQGYETINISTLGLLPNIVTIASTHGPSALVIDGAADLTLVNTGGLGAGSLDILNVSVLDEVDATLLSGDLTGTFTGTGDVVVQSGSGDDMLTFATTGMVEVHGNDGDDWLGFGEFAEVTATGGDGDDTFAWDYVFGPGPNAGSSSFTTASSVDGGDGYDVLSLMSDGGDLLRTGVGSNIVAIEEILHTSTGPTYGFDELDGDLDIDMSRSGSANVLRLAGDYDFWNVMVDNLTNDDWVILQHANGASGEVNDLELDHASNTALDIINFRMNAISTTADNEIDGALIVDSQVDLLKLDSVGDVAPNGFINNNDINYADQIDTNIEVTGDHNLSIGDEAAYDWTDGIVDASAFTGDLIFYVGFGGQQTILSGSGDDFISVQSYDDSDVIDISTGGNDVIEHVEFRYAGFHTLDEYNQFLGFDVADDVVQLTDVSLTAAGYLEEMDSGGVAAGDDLVTLDYVAGTSVIAGVNVNFIKFTTAVNDATLTTADEFFDAAIGLGEIATPGGGAGTDYVLAAMYDAVGEQMILFAVDVNSGGDATAIQNDDDINVAGIYHISYADFLAFDGSNVEFA